MKEVGIVDKLVGNNAKVVIQRHAACGDCSACQVGKEKMTMETLAKNPIASKPGDLVEVEMQFTSVFRAAGIMYGIPLIAFIIGCVSVYYGIVYFDLLWDQVLAPFFTGIVFMGISYGFIKLADNKGAFTSKYQPIITNILEKEM
ncbi:MAG: SoxR reducing system RseC family protein [Eubacteriaceae bacterium]